MVLWTSPTVKNLYFTNPRWRTAAILKIVISLQLCDRFWWNFAWWCILALCGKIVHKNFWKCKMAASAILKIIKIAISPQRFDRSLRNLVHWCKIGLLTSPTVKKSKFHKSSKWLTAVILKTAKIAMSLQLCGRFWWNLAQCRTLAHYRVKI